MLCMLNRCGPELPSLRGTVNPSPCRIFDARAWQEGHWNRTRGEIGARLTWCACSYRRVEYTEEEEEEMHGRSSACSQ